MWTNNLNEYLRRVFIISQTNITITGILHVVSMGADKIIPAHMSFLSTVMWYNKPNRCNSAI